MKEGGGVGGNPGATQEVYVRTALWTRLQTMVV